MHSVAKILLHIEIAFLVLTLALTNNVVVERHTLQEYEQQEAPEEAINI